MSVIKYVMKEKSFDLRRDVCVDDKKDWPFLLNLKHLCFRVIHRMPDSLRITCQSLIFAIRGLTQISVVF